MESFERKQEAKEELLARLKMLQAQEDDTKAMIQAINITLREMGLMIDTTATDGAQAGPHTGIQINGELSFRGKQKCEEYFRFVDDDHDGKLNFEDFRAMRGFRSQDGISHEPEMLNHESWIMHMHDMGVDITPDGQVDMENFIKYRTAVESKQPLSKELEYIRLGYLPAVQQKWLLLKKLIHEIYDLRDSLLMQVGEKPLVRDEAHAALSLEELSFVLNNLGENYTKPEIAQLMLQRCRKGKFVEDIQRGASKKFLADSTFVFLVDEEEQLVTAMQTQEDTKVTMQEFEQIPPKKLIPWLFSKPFELNPALMYRQLLGFKYGLIRGMRKVNDRFKEAYHFMGHINDRLVFRDFLPLNKSIFKPAVNELMNMKIGLGVGDEGSREGGFSLAFKLIKVDNPEQLLKKFGAPHDAGCSLVLDFLLRKGATEEKTKRLASLLRMFMNVHFEKELKGSMQYMGFTAFPAVNENDGSKVLRLCISYKRLLSLDNYLEQMLIPYRLHELVNVLTGEIRTNFDLSDMIHYKYDLNLKFAATAELNLLWRHGLVTMLLERISLAAKAAMSPDQAAFDEVVETEKVNERKEAIYQKHGVNVKSQKLADKEDIGLRRLMRWKVLQPIMPYIAGLADRTLSALRVMRMGSMKFKFTTIGELMHYISTNNCWFKKYFPDTIVYQMGWIKKNFEEYAKKFQAEWSGEHARLESFLRTHAEIAHAKRMNQMIDAKRKAEEYAVEEKDKTAETMRRLGMDTEDLFEEEQEDPLSLLEKEATEADRHDILGLLTLEYFRENVLALHTMDFFNGGARLAMNVGGVDFFDIIPELPSMQAATERHKVKHNTAPPI